jgi:peptidyl-prolyl cis-trans isomerase SurA
MLRVLMKERFLTILLVGMALAAPAAPSATQLLNGIVAIVDGKVITENEAREFIEPVIDFLKKRHGHEPKVFQEKALKAYRDGLDELINRQLMLLDFESEGFRLPQRFVENFVQNRIREQYGDRPRLIKTLEQQGMTYEDFRQEIRDQFVIEQMQSRNVSSGILISPYKIEKSYEENVIDFRLPDQIKLRMIVLNIPEGADPAGVEKLANELLRKITDVVEFKEVASIYSEGAQAADGGDWGWIETKVLRKELADAAKLLKKGETSGVIKTADACYVMYLEDVRIAYVRPLHEVRDEIEGKLIAEERKRLQQIYIDGLRKKAFIRFF